MQPNIRKHDEVVRVLHQIQAAGFTSAIIAGGAIRDLYFDIMPTDIDIFVWDPAYSSENTSHDARHPDRGPSFWKSVMKLNNFSSDYYAADRVTRNYHTTSGGYDQMLSQKFDVVWNVMKNYVPYQIILTHEKPTIHVKKHFDIGLCKAYCDGRKLRYTADFMYDMKNKQATVVAQEMTQSEFDHTMNHHIPKLSAKFPGYTLAIAPHNVPLYVDYITRNR